ncbi:unnamed protein product [Mytilus coruscus]|uniref:Uncharacterized protein n=1 Tax=Mytilus coruscus TaxID=42192 RepID=A0A6J8A4Q2_MYTCO|nr:unnamed protein product [Mytilus coruscus]
MASSYSRSRSNSVSSNSSNDHSNIGDRDSLPKSTSQWDMLFLEKLGISYNNEYHASPLDILDMINSKTGCFGSLRDEQTEYIGDLKETLGFDISLKESSENEQTPEQFALTDVVLPKLEEELLKIRQHYSSRKRVMSIPEEFVKVVALILRYELGRYKSVKRMGPATEDLYVTVFNIFARMCGVETIPGSLWRTKMEVGNTDVTSTADILIVPVECLDSFRKDYPVADSVAVVSVVEGKRFSSRPEEQLVTQNSIYDYVDHKTLGQHGGKLLLHLQNYNNKLTRGRRLLPGIIVMGTEVIFTVLEIEPKHLSQVYSEDSVDSRAKIYYSKPKDFLKKADRDVLMEAIMRLNNIK